MRLLHERLGQGELARKISDTVQVIGDKLDKMDPSTFEPRLKETLGNCLFAESREPRQGLRAAPRSGLLPADDAEGTMGYGAFRSSEVT